MTEERKYRGLSYSSFSEFSACQKKWFYRKVAKYPIDTDASESTEAFDLGKSFHRCLELTMHDLKGFTFEQCVKTCAEFNVIDIDSVAMIFAMLGKYKKLHEASGLSIVACEVGVDLPNFYGIADVLMEEKDVGLWIVDLKTASTFQQSTVQSVSSHTQLNLYAKHYDEFAYAAGVKDLPFAGIKLRTVTKSRLERKGGETTEDYIRRMSKGIKAVELTVPYSLLKKTGEIYEAHQRAFSLTSAATTEDEDKFSRNYGNCFSFFRPCEFHSRCHGYNYTEAPAVTKVEF